MKKLIVCLLTFITLITSIYAADNNKKNEDNWSTLTYENIPVLKVTIPDSVEHIDYYALAWCDSLEFVEISSSVTSIGSYAFHGCSSLDSVTIPSSVTAIGTNAFAACYSLTYVAIPQSVTFIGHDAFRGITFLDASDEVLDQTAGALKGHLFQGSSGILKEVIPGKGDRFASSGLIYEIISLDPLNVNVSGYEGSPSSVTVPSAVSYGGLEFDVVGVGDLAFRQCPTLRSVDLGSCMYVGERSFSLCSALESVDMPCVASLAYCAFSQCTSLKEIAFSDDLSTVGKSAFYKVVFYDVGGNKLSHAAANLAGKTFELIGGKLTAISATGIMIDRATLFLEGGASYILTATVIPTGCTDPVVWTSSDVSVCTVSDGLVIALNDGECTITATVGKESAFCMVTVNKSMSIGEQDALNEARDYISALGISKTRLTDYLIDDGFTESEAAYGVDNCGADWDQEALQKARSYMSVLGPSKDDLERYLLGDGFVDSEVEYAVNASFA